MSRAEWRRGRAQIGAVELAYARAGAGPQLLLAHGMADDGWCWGRVAEDLLADHELVVYDARAHGESSAPAGGFGSAELAADLLGLLRALRLERPVLIGHSMGAETCAIAAAAAPELVSGLVLEDPPWRADPGWPSPEQDAQVRAWLGSLAAQSEEQLVAAQRPAAAAWTEPELRAWAASKRRARPQVASYLAAPRDDWRRTVARLGCPALLLMGDPAAGAIVDEPTRVELGRLSPWLRCLRLEGAGHDLRRDRFPAYIGALRGFLADIRAG